MIEYLKYFLEFFQLFMWSRSLANIFGVDQRTIPDLVDTLSVTRGRLCVFFLSRVPMQSMNYSGTTLCAFPLTCTGTEHQLLWDDSVCVSTLVYWWVYTNNYIILYLMRKLLNPLVSTTLVITFAKKKIKVWLLCCTVDGSFNIIIIKFKCIKFKCIKFIWPLERRSNVSCH